jgi:hypothetical protein
MTKREVVVDARQRKATSKKIDQKTLPTHSPLFSVQAVGQGQPNVSGL